MKDQVLTKQQMDELIALGVSIESASMAERYDINGDFVEYVTSKSVSCNVGFIVPVFTVTDMLDLIPYFVTEDFEDYCYLHIEKLIDRYTCSYKAEGDYLAKGILYLSEGRLEKDAVYSTLIQLIQGGKLSKPK